MSTVVPPSPIPPTQVLSLPRATVLAAPPALADLAVGIKLDVIVATLPEANRITLDTPHGPVTLSLPFKPVVSVGQPLILHLVGLAGKDGHPKVAISLPDGKPPTVAPAQVQVGGAGTGAAVQTSGGPATVPSAPHLGVGISVTATLLRPVVLSPQGIIQAAVNTAIQNATASTPQTTATVTGGAATPQQTTQTPQTGGTATPTPQQAGGAPQQQTAQPNVLPAGSGLSLRIVSVKPPEGPLPSLTPPPQTGNLSLTPGATLTGTVSGQQGPNSAVVQTHAGPMTLPTDKPIAPGTQITFELLSLKPAPPPTPGVHAAASPMTSGTWPVLADAVDVLADISPGAQAHLIQAALPRSDAQLATNIMFFLSAIRGGDVKSWLGDGPLRILERQRPDVAARLKDDVGGASRRVRDPETGDWRQFAIPFLHDGDIDSISLLTRDDDDDDDEDSDNDGSRFVIDLNLSRLGHMQIDGLVGANNKRLDVVVRTDQPLASEMRQDIRALYANALEVTGLEGSVGFQAAPGNFVKIAAPPAPSNEDVVV